MNEFRILSIDEFDALFVKDLRIKKAEPPKTDSGLIPELITDNNASAAVIEKPAVTDAESSLSDIPTAVETNQNISTDDSSSSPLVDVPQENTSSVIVDDASFENTDEKKEEKKKKNDYLAGKVVSIVMLSITAVVFLLGCFISVFLDNNGLDIGGICFSTQSRDIIVGDDEIGKGALIISKKLQPEQYSENLNKPVAVRADKNASSGCDIMFLYSASESYEAGTVLQVYDPMTNEISENTYLSSECSGIVRRYLPAVGGILTFAINNAVLVCALFVLLAAFWCLLLVLFEKNNKRKY